MQINNSIVDNTIITINIGTLSYNCLSSWLLNNSGFIRDAISFDSTNNVITIPEIFDQKMFSLVLDIIYDISNNIILTLDQYKECIKIANYLRLSDDLLRIVEVSDVHIDDAVIIYQTHQNVRTALRLINNILINSNHLGDLTRLNDLNDDQWIYLYRVYILSLEYCIMYVSEYRLHTWLIFQKLSDKHKILGLLMWDMLDTDTIKNIQNSFETHTAEFKLINWLLYRHIAISDNNQVIDYLHMVSQDLDYIDTNEGELDDPLIYTW